MEKLNIELQHCYGIKQLQHTFDFHGKSVISLYAPNGTMKTSFAKTFSDLQNGKLSKDLIFPDRETTRNIKDENNYDITPEKIFVIEPYNEAFKSEKMSTLLVNKELKEKYDKIYTDLENLKDSFIAEMKKRSGLKVEIEEEISQTFTSYPNEFFKVLGRLKTEVMNAQSENFGDIEYSEIFNDKVIKFLETKDFSSRLEDYIEKYEELVDSSTYFKRGVFNHNNAATIAKNLSDNGFFQAKHSLSLNSDGKESTAVGSLDELTHIIEEEKNSILSDESLSKAFEEIDKKLKANQDMRNFRDYLLKNMKLLPELKNLDGLKQKIWLSYFMDSKIEFLTLENKYSEAKKDIESIVEQAKKEETDWRNVIDIFNRRFSVPFELVVINQEDVILKQDGPNINFKFTDSSDSCEVKEQDLLTVLSNGEKRALYILNIIFEVEARKNQGLDTLFIVDDIADSFDYKNKYAIIEYLKDISSKPNFKQIILTHNFDFHRTVSSRLDMERRHKLTAFKNGDSVVLKQEHYQNNPFTHWKQHLSTPSMLIASIPFVRNIAEFTGDINSFEGLTSLLHIKNNTKTISLDALKTSFNQILNDAADFTALGTEKTVHELIMETGDSLSQLNHENLKLEDKITFAIAIRLKAEEYMIDKINDPELVANISSNQTYELYEKFVELFPEEVESITLLDQVNLMTPENIHVNSFMYEPILDMGSGHLKALYLNIDSLLN
ncbi:MAG: AAA family ATPase [Crocinitomicaceae bacterium]